MAFGLVDLIAVYILQAFVAYVALIESTKIIHRYKNRYRYKMYTAFNF